MRFVLCALLAVTLFIPAVPAPAQDVFLVGGHLVDPRSRTVREENLLIVDGVIAGTPEAPPQGFGGEVVDAEGLWVLPGLRDLHVHSMLNQAPGGVREVLGSEEAAQRMLFAGVVGFLDLFNDEDFIFGLRDRQRVAREVLLGDGSGEGTGDRSEVGLAARAADVFAAGPCLTAPGGHCTEYGVPTRTIDSPEAARREVRNLAGRRPDVVKLVYAHPTEQGADAGRARPSIDRPTLQAAVATARELGLPTVVHVESWQDVRDCARAGVTAVTHIPGPTPGPESDGPPIPEDVPGLLARAGTVVIPTLAVRDPAFVTRPEILDRPLLQALAGPEILRAYRQWSPADAPEGFRHRVEGLPAAREQKQRAVRALAEAGVPLVAGTDAGNLWTVQGWSLHRELALYVDAGLDPWRALAAATTEAGELLGRSWGLDPGDPGSLVLLEASPLERVENTERIAGVIHHGVAVDREALLEAGREAEQQAAVTLSPEELDRLVGTYCAESGLTLTLEIVEADGAATLRGTAPGRPPFTLAPVSATRFRIDGAPPGFALAFEPAGEVPDGRVESLTLEQGAGPTTSLTPCAPGTR